MVRTTTSYTSAHIKYVTVTPLQVLNVSNNYLTQHSFTPDVFTNMKTLLTLDLRNNRLVSSILLALVCYMTYLPADLFTC